MRVRVLLFGILRELAGQQERDFTIDEGATVGDVVVEAARLIPGTALWPSIATAVNQEYAPRERLLAEGDVVALLPPVSGG